MSFSSNAENRNILGKRAIALLQLHNGVGSREGDALANAVGSVRQLDTAIVAHEVIAAREPIASAAFYLELEGKNEGCRRAMNQRCRLTVAAVSLASRVDPETPIN